MSLFAASSFYLYGEFSVCTKEELKSVIEKHGGKVTSRISPKTSYVVCSGHTRDTLEKSKNFNLALLSESYIMDCINAKKKLPVANYVSQQDKKGVVHKKDCSDDGDVYDFVGTSDNHNNKENHVNKLKEKLKRISLSKNGNNKRENEDDDHNMIISSKKLRQATKRSESGDETDNLPSLKDLELILDNGGKISCAVDDSVTHFLFGGESVDVPEFQEAQRRKIHIVNEYFLRLLVKY